MRSEGTSGHCRAWCVVFMWFVLGSDGHGALLFRVGFCCFSVGLCCVHVVFCCIDMCLYVILGVIHTFANPT